MSRNKHNPMPLRPVPLLGSPQPVKFEHQHVAGPLAFPATAVLQQPGKIDVVTIGGQFRVEALAGQLAASLVQQRDEYSGTCWHKSPEACDDVARDAVALARALMAELARPEEVKQPEAKKNEPPSAAANEGPGCSSEGHDSSSPSQYTAHDASRLAKAMACHPPCPQTEEEFRQTHAAVWEAIGGLQSTDDPAPIFKQEHTRLQAMAERLRDIAATYGWTPRGTSIPKG